MTGSHPLFACLACLCGALALLVAAPAAAQDGEGWALDPYARAEIGVVFSESEDREEDLIINGDGAYARGQVGLLAGDGVSEFRLEADRIEVRRFGNATARDSFNRDRLTAAFSQDIGDDWNVTLQGRIYDDLVTVEASDTDERQVSAQLEYEPVQAHRLRLRGAWRDREYDDGEGPDGTSSTGKGPRVDLEYRHRLGRYHYINVDLRAEEIESDTARRGYTRESVGASYTHPLTSDVRVRPAFEWRHTVFGGRLTPDMERREDTQFVPEVELLWWPGDWRIEAEAKYVFSDSNDPVRDRQGYRFSVSVGRVF